MVIIAVALGLLAVLVATPLRSGVYVLFAVVALRALCDYGLVSGARPAALSALSTVLPVVIIVYAAILVFAGRLNRILRWLASAAFFLVLWQLVAVLDFGLRESLVLEAVRLFSIFAVVGIAYGASADGSVRDCGRYALALSAPAVGVGVVGALGSLPHFSANDRFTFTFSHPNSAGVYLGATLLIALCLALSTGTLAAWAATGVALVLLGLTASLTSFVGAAIGGVVLLLSSRALTTARKLRFALIGVVMLAAAVQLLGVSKRFEEFTRASADSGSPDSFQWRLENWRLLYEQWKSSKLVGFGTGTTNSIITPLGGPPHNVYVQVLVEYGLIGVIFGAFVAIALIRMSIKLSRGGRGALAAAPLALFAFMAVNAFAGNTLGYTAGMYLVAAAIGLAFGNNRFLAERSEESIMTVDRENEFQKSDSRVERPARPVGGVS